MNGRLQRAQRIGLLAYALRSRAPFAFCRTPYTLHRTPYTLHRTPNTEHLTPNTKHRTPNTLPALDRRFGLITLLIALFALPLLAQQPTNTIETWSEPGLAGWTNSSPEVTLSNPGGYLNMQFQEQPQAPYAVSDIARVNVGADMTITNISFKFRSADIYPSALRVYVHSSASDNSWYVSLTAPAPGEWAEFSLPLSFSMRWIMGPNSSEQQFRQDMLTIDWVGVYVRRHGTPAAQAYHIDDFALHGLTVPLDSDGDGLSDEWEVLYGLNPNQPSDAGLDGDGDGMNNHAEYIAGTDPTDAASRFEVAINAANGTNSVTGAVLRWKSIAYRTYSIHRSANLMEGFTEIDFGILATPPENEYSDITATNSGPYFYKIQVE